MEVDGARWSSDRFASSSGTSTLRNGQKSRRFRTWQAFLLQDASGICMKESSDGRSFVALIHDVDTGIKRRLISIERWRDVEMGMKVTRIIHYQALVTEVCALSEFEFVSSFFPLLCRRTRTFQSSPSTSYFPSFAPRLLVIFCRLR